MESEVFSAYLTATGAVTTTRVRVVAVTVTGTGTVTFKDGGASGTTHITLNATGNIHVIIPHKGVLFTTDCYATFAGITAITVFYV